MRIGDIVKLDDEVASRHEVKVNVGVYLADLYRTAYSKGVRDLCTIQDDWALKNREKAYCDRYARAWRIGQLVKSD